MFNRREGNIKRIKIKLIILVILIVVSLIVKFINR
jgi:hypothetical protein